MRSRGKIIYCVLAILLICGAIYFFINYYTKISICAASDVKVISKIDNKGNVNINIIPKNKDVYLTTEISDSDTYVIYEKRSFPWNMKINTNLQLNYFKLKDSFQRPNGTKLRRDENQEVVLKYCDNQQKIISLLP